MLKRLCVSLAPLAVILMLAGPLFAQDSGSKKPKDCTGVISADGQSFTCDKDHKVWKVSNPAVLQGMEGHHAKVTFRPNPSEDVLVLSASAVSQQQQSANAADAPPHN